MVKNFWANASPERKKTIVTVMAVGVVGVLSWGMVAMTSNGPVERKKNQRPLTHDLLTVKDPKTLGIDGLKAEIDQLKKQVRDIASAAPKEPAQRSPERPADREAPLTLPPIVGEEIPPEDMAALEKIRNAPPVTPKPTSARTSTPPSKRTASARQQDAEDSAESTPSPKKLEIKTYGDAEETAKAEDGDKETVETVAGKKDARGSRFVLPAGSIMEGVLITGLDAPTASHARQQPFPALVRVKHEALLPNRWRTDIRECFVIASGYGDMASERAYLRAESISCVRDDGTIMESTMDGFASGEDGKSGVRGRLVSKQGSMIAKALMGGFLQGVANVYKPARIPQLSLDTGGGREQYARPDAAQTLQEGAYGGMQSAAKAVADFYIDMARNTFPIIEIDAGRKVTFIVGRSINVSSRNGMQQGRGGNQQGNGLMGQLQNTPIGRTINSVTNGRNGQTPSLYQP